METEEDRRRGDHRLARRAATRAGFAVLAVVTVVGGVALGSAITESDPPAPPVAQDPSPADGMSPRRSAAPPRPQATSVPRDLPLLAGVPDEDADTERTSHRDLDRARLFDPCHDDAGRATEPGRADLLQVMHSGPGYGYSRELVVYESSSAAEAAMLLARDELERCPLFRYDDGLSSDRWQPSPAREADLPADDVLSAVNHGFTDDMLTTLATHWIVARVGNAVLTMALDGEFGASDASVRATASDEVDSYHQIVGKLCPFAERATQAGCTAGD